MSDLSLEEWMASRRERIDRALDEAIPAGDSNEAGQLREGMRYAVLQGGKRMRPLLVAAACEAVGASVEESLPGACALEMIHAYSLVHDDLPAMDDDAERRGKPTVHVAFGEANAILVGDALLTRAFEVLARGTEGVAPAAMAKAVQILAYHAGIDGMVGGQGKDLAWGQDIDTLERLEEVHALKTGGLYAAAGALGALCGGASGETVDRLERYGLCFGIAFQHADDILDDDQEALREKAIARVEALVGECREIAGAYGERGRTLVAIADWVAARTARAASGDRAD